jgi:hypothetical protein
MQPSSLSEPLLSSSAVGVAAPVAPGVVAPEEDIDFQALKFVTPTELVTRKLFDKYASSDDAWQLQDVRYFLIDFLPAMGMPAFVADQVVHAAVKEIQLTGGTVISWVEFKSFFLYLHQQPFNDLLLALLTVIPVAELNARALHVSQLPTDIQV